MADYAYEEEDDTFVDYDATTVDPGYTLLVATTLFCIVSNLLLPCMVSLSRRGEKLRLVKRQRREQHQREQQRDNDNDANEIVNEEDEPGEQQSDDRTTKSSSQEESKGDEGVEESKEEEHDTPLIYPVASYDNDEKQDSSGENAQQTDQKKKNRPTMDLEDWHKLLGEADGLMLSKPEPPIRCNTASDDIPDMLAELSFSSSAMGENNTTHSVATTSFLDMGWGATGRRAITGTGRRVKGRGIVERRRLEEQQRRESIARINKNKSAEETNSPQEDGAGPSLWFPWFASWLGNGMQQPDQQEEEQQSTTNNEDDNEDKNEEEEENQPQQDGQSSHSRTNNLSPVDTNKDDDDTSSWIYPKSYSPKKSSDNRELQIQDSSQSFSSSKQMDPKNRPTDLKDWHKPLDGVNSLAETNGCKVPQSAPIRCNTASDNVPSSLDSSAIDDFSVSSNATTSFLDKRWRATGRRAITGTGRRVRGPGIAERRRLQEQQRRESIVRINRNNITPNGEAKIEMTPSQNQLPLQDVIAGVMVTDGDKDTLSKADDQEILPNDAPDAGEQGDDDDMGRGLLLQEGYDLSCCGKRAWWRLSTLARAVDDLLLIAEWEHESKRIVKLAIPYSSVAVMEGLFDTVLVGLIAHYIGTDAVAAYTVVELIVGLSSEFVGGVVESVGVLCPHAIGARNPKLAGQYVQLSMILYTALSIPFFFLWAFATDTVFRWFGFDEEVAKMGQQYAIIGMFEDWTEGIHESYQNLLDVIECEKWSSFISIAEGATGTIIVVIVLELEEGTTLNDVAIIMLALCVTFMIFDVAYTIHKGWVSDYLEGMVGSLALRNHPAVMNMINTALPLAIGSLIEYGEWEFLTIFAAVLGPAEVTAWGIIGSLWETIEATTIGMADAGEVRCAYQLGAGRPAKARKSAYKSIYIGFILSMIVTSIVFILGEDIATWLTPDPTLQRMIVEIMPLIGIGNITLTIGSVTWALVGAQGRYRLATCIAFMTSWGVTLPLAALFSYGFKINLQGLTSALVIGYSATGTALTYVLLRSDWDRHSKNIVTLNAEENAMLHTMENDVSSSSSSSSSSPSLD